MSHHQTFMPNAKESMRELANKVLSEKGYPSDNMGKYELAQDLGISLNKGYNGNIKAKDAGKIGGSIGGQMVKEMVKMAQRSLQKP
ncbi:hypothetical protein JOD43_000166 [Pullulanibacillus pueri]|uniref:Small, acid-soluble spore protein, alpha/beta type n=1 Tax=Pullulanibacillus pueri TaxID=1437324 RepID=A0A8J3EK49_9BACL|nr:alpha/beta-type small acid-soluble spore protein [Pullulanibacillus pueri]MBM7680007.1 hypothetical protein [Pullulanibacillus pueri]GGH73909.1 hypothetical protein GCM10007096_01610 [Pullulanibacillus pueri]